MWRICRRVVIIDVTTHTGIRSRVVITVMTLITGSGNMRPGKSPVIVVGRHGSRRPARVRGMAGFAGSCDAGCSVIRIICPVIGIHMTGITSCRCSAETACMTITAWKGSMSPCERKTVIMIEGSACTACWMTRITGNACINIPAYTLVLVVHFRLVVVRMAIDTAEGCIV